MGTLYSFERLNEKTYDWIKEEILDDSKSKKQISKYNK